MDIDLAMHEEHTSRAHAVADRRTPPWLSPLLVVSLLCGAWLLSTRTLHRWVLDVAGEGTFVLYLLLVLPVFAGVLLWSIIHAVRGLDSWRRLAVLPLLANILALALFLFAPVGRPLDDLDFQIHRAAREDVVERIQAGELWNGQPGNSVAFLPPEYPHSVSASGQRSVTVYRQDGVLHVLFYLHPGLRGLEGEHAAFLYRADGQPPFLSNPHLWNAISSERLDEHWYRVLYK